MANEMSSQMEEYLKRLKAWGYEPSLDGLDRADIESILASQNRERQQSPTAPDGSSAERAMEGFNDFFYR